MPEIAINAGVDFLYAKLHGWWSRSAHGATLEELTRATTEENYIHLLQNYDIITIRDKGRVTQELILRMYERLGHIARLIGAPADRFFQNLQLSLRLENFKTILNFRYFQEQVGNVADHLIRFPGQPQSGDNLLAMLHATDTKQFVAMLPKMEHSEQLRTIIENLDRDHNQMAAECALDNLAFAGAIESTGSLPLGMRKVALELLKYEIDSINAVTLLRNVNFYHLPADQLEVAWIDGGQRITCDQWKHLSESQNLKTLLEQMPTEFASMLAPHYTEHISQLENRLNSHLYKMARGYFNNACEPHQAIPAYVWLLRAETVNLSRVYEGVRFSLPPRSIQEILVQFS